MKKRIAALVFAVALVIAMDTSSLSSNPAILSDLPVEEQLEYLQEQGVEVPPGPEYAEYVIGLIPRFETDPDFFPYGISNRGTRELAARVEDAVNRYYQRDSRPRPEKVFFL